MHLHDKAAISTANPGDEPVESEDVIGHATESREDENQESPRNTAQEDNQPQAESIVSDAEMRDVSSRQDRDQDQDQDPSQVCV